MGFKFTDKQVIVNTNRNSSYYNLPCISFSNETVLVKKLRNYANYAFCKSTNIKVVFSLFH